MSTIAMHKLNVNNWMYAVGIVPNPVTKNAVCNQNYENEAPFTCFHRCLKAWFYCCKLIS